MLEAAVGWVGASMTGHWKFIWPARWDTVDIVAIDFAAMFEEMDSGKEFC